jgi:hypothetical protein
MREKRLWSGNVRLAPKSGREAIPLKKSALCQEQTVLVLVVPLT